MIPAARVRIGMTCAALVLEVSLPVTALSVERVSVLVPVADGTGLSAPLAIDLDTFRGTLVVADTEADRILLLDRQGGLKKVLGREGRIRRPVAVAVTREGALYFAERGHEGLKVLAAYDSEQRESFKTIDLEPYRGKRPVNPVALSVSDEGTIFVADAANRSILVLAPDGSLVRSIHRVGQPSDVLIASQRLRVADPAFGRVQIYDGDGRLRRTLGDASSRTPNPLRPVSVLVDRRERIWVVEEEGGIRVLDLFGNLLHSLSDPGLFVPSDAVLDRDGTLYVLERGGNRISVFSVQEF